MTSSEVPISERWKGLFHYDGNSPIFLIDHRHRFIAMGTFNVDKVVEETDAVVIDKEIELLAAGRAGGEISFEK